MITVGSVQVLQIRHKWMQKTFGTCDKKPRFKNDVMGLQISQSQPVTGLAEKMGPAQQPRIINTYSYSYMINEIK
jgi:hypothetical protein